MARRRKGGSGRRLVLEGGSGRGLILDRGSGRGLILDRMHGNRGSGCGQILNRRVGRRRCVLEARGGGGARGGGRRLRSGRRIHAAPGAIREHHAEYWEELGRDAACKEPAPFFDLRLQGLPLLWPLAVVELDV